MNENALLDLFAAMERLRGPAYECKSYPCHFEGQDCSLCFCPFYPCLLYPLGGELIVSSKGKLVWSCKNCRWIHEKENVEEIVTYFSSFPRQILVEADWFFYSKSLQEILFGEELGKWIRDNYSLIEANCYGYAVEKTDICSSVAVKIENFQIVDVEIITSLEEVSGRVIVPEKRGDVLLGISNGCVEWRI